MNKEEKVFDEIRDAELVALTSNTVNSYELNKPKTKEQEKVLKQLSGTVFTIGETIKIKEEEFEVSYVSRKRITLKPKGW